MKVAVMGILERQAKLAGHFPDLDLKYIQNKKTGDGLKYTDTINNCDRILVNTKFISHKAVEAIDKSKAIFINGGVGAVRAELKRLNYLARLHKQEQRPPVITIAHRPPTPEPTAMSPTKHDSSNAELYAGNPGDLFTFTKPQGLEDRLWRMRLAAVRTYAKHHKGRDTEIEFVGNQARIMITKMVLPDKGPKARKARVQENRALAPTPKSDWTPSKDVMGTASLLWRETFLDQLAAKNVPSVSTQVANDAADAYLKWYRKHA